jgi:hypothetical protein
MLGLGSSISRSGKIGPTVLRDNLVLKHDYYENSVQPVSTGAAYFDDSGDDYISIGNPANLNMGNGSFSVSCWAKSIPGDHLTDADFVVAKADGEATAVGSDEGYALYLGASRTDWIFWVSDGTGAGKAQATDATVANQWYHLCGTFDGSRTVRLYVDGVLVNTGTASDGSAVDLGDIDVGNDFNIGRATSTTRDFSGYICNVGVWKGVVLTQPQVKSIMHKDYAGLSASEKTGLSSWWNLDSTVFNGTTPTIVLDSNISLGTELVTDGSFANGFASWTASNVTLSSAGAVIYDDDADYIYQDITYSAGNTYAITLEGTGDVRVAIADASVGAVMQTATLPATLYRTFTNNGEDKVKIFGSNPDSPAIVSSVSVKVVNGNHGTLA